MVSLTSALRPVATAHSKVAYAIDYARDYINGTLMDIEHPMGFVLSTEIEDVARALWESHGFCEWINMREGFKSVNHYQVFIALVHIRPWYDRSGQSAPWRQVRRYIAYNDL